MTTQLLAGSASDLNCPGCKTSVQLVSRPLTKSGVTALECPHCVGLWLGLESFHVLLSEEPGEATKASPNHVPQPAEVRQGYRKCVVCGELMTRRNFGSRSGVVVDLCGRHGVWFDADELTQLLAWARSGGLEAARDELAKLQNSPDRVRKREVEKRSESQRPIANVANASARPSLTDAPTDGPNGWFDLFSIVGELLFHFTTRA